MTDGTMTLALIEVLDRDGQVRQTLPVQAWPVAIGRAIDNDLVLADPHVAAHHLRLVAGEDGTPAVEVGSTLNGVVLGAHRHRAGASVALPAGGAAPLLAVGRTRLRVRLPGHALDAELPVAVPSPRWQSRPLLAATLAALLGAVLFQAWLDADPDTFGRAAGGALLTLAAGAALWCGAWALLSRIFARQAQFGWHLRVFVLGSLAWIAVEALAGLVAFALGWAWLSSWRFVGGFVVAGAALGLHLLAVEPARPRLMRSAGAVAAAAGIALTLWSHHQRGGRLGGELYLAGLMPPAFRLAPAVPVDRFVDGLAALQEPLERKAREDDKNDPSTGDEE
jgi:hypothetical protein